VQRNAIKQLVGDNFKTLYEDKMELFDVISNWNPDIIHIHDCAERLDIKLITKLYDNNRSYHIIETCHDVSFKPDTEKIVHPDYYAFCTPYHLETFAHLPSKKELIEFPIDPLIPTKSQVIDAKWALGMHVSKYHVVNIGLWTSGKNQGEMLELAKKMPDVEFHFVGNQAGNFKDYWEPLMVDVPKNVTIWGERDDTDVFMKAADLFMFNSTWECNPLVLREAISNNKKIIARNLPQYKDMFTPYITNLNPNNLENQLREVLDSDDSYVISESNTTEIFKDSLLNLYQKTFKSFKEINDMKDYTITQHFVGQPFLEITGTSDSLFTVEFYDDFDTLIHKSEIKCNHWVKVNREYFTKWKVLVYKDDEIVYDTTLDYTDKRVYISFESSSLGDTIAWIPYALEFKKKHNCHVIVSTFKNFLFESVYPELEFVNPGTNVVNIQGMYKLGWFYNNYKEPMIPNTIPLQQTATNILGLEYTEIKPRIAVKIHKTPEEKYVTIATNSTAGCKFWTKEGWQEVINYLVDNGYKVINVSKENNPFHNCTQLKDNSIDSTIECISNSEFFIGLSSGLSWMAWALGKQVVMISNFTDADHEFKCIRVTNTNVCHGCWNKAEFKFDRGDWSWCPLHKNTPRHFECHRGISAKQVIDSLVFLKDL
jgi:autotransporter strand-loop-strand O-heptosyltransferase